ncbi:UNVERIFIED_CONTAM: hypothetical protein Sradi_1224200 [Sesamum radiatum]|uniref:Uncharacterized protein n=1 Tax=Sesamum radiatum TaxID=300843 RepID=A0AAW2UM73_SESRA
MSQAICSAAVSLKFNSPKSFPLTDASIGRLHRFRTASAVASPSRWSLHGYTALVTGGTRGIGYG